MKTKKRGQNKKLKFFELHLSCKKKSTKAQMKLSFGMIFSIILITVFLAFSFYAIQKFLDLQNEIKLEQFKKNLQEDVDKMWGKAQGAESFQYFLPKKVTKVCFKDDEFGNLLIYFDILPERETIEHIDMEKTLSGQRTLCFKNAEGKVKMLIKKDYRENFVTISAQNGQ